MGPDKPNSTVFFGNLQENARNTYFTDALLQLRTEGVFK